MYPRLVACVYSSDKFGYQFQSGCSNISLRAMNDISNRVSVISEYGQHRLRSNVQVSQGEILFKEQSWASSSHPTEMGRILELMRQIMDIADIRLMVSNPPTLTIDDQRMISALMNESRHYDDHLSHLLNLYQLIRMMSKQFQYQGVFRLASTMKHDCDPSTTCSIFGDDITVKQRQNQFKALYGIDCDCASCKGFHPKNGIMNYNPFIDIDH